MNSIRRTWLVLIVAILTPIASLAADEPGVSIRLVVDAKWPLIGENIPAWCTFRNNTGRDQYLVYSTFDWLNLQVTDSEGRPVPYEGVLVDRPPGFINLRAHHTTTQVELIEGMFPRLKPGNYRIQFISPAADVDSTVRWLREGPVPRYRPPPKGASLVRNRLESNSESIEVRSIGSPADDACLMELWQGFQLGSPDRFEPSESRLDEIAARWPSSNLCVDIEAEEILLFAEWIRRRWIGDDERAIELRRRIAEFTTGHPTWPGLRYLYYMAAWQALSSGWQPYAEAYATEAKARWPGHPVNDLLREKLEDTHADH